MAAQTQDLWSLALDYPEVDPNDLAKAVSQQAEISSLDYCTRLLIRDSVDAVTSYWGEARVARWLASTSAGATIKGICSQSFDKEIATDNWKILFGEDLPS
jgi:hypothetical protein